MEGTNLIPQSAWVQAVFVCLFIVITVVLLNWFSRQQDKWQKFINDRDTQWQNWMNKAEQRINEQMCEITTALEKLAELLSVHGGKVERHMNEFRQSIQPPKPRTPRKKSTGSNS